jgi:transcriptional regulator with GAF, ATPase, and Fis domain
MRTESVPDLPAHVQNDPALALVVSELLWRAGHAETTATYLRNALPAVSRIAGGDSIALATSQAGHWTALAQAGDDRPLPGDLLAEVLDAESPGMRASWVAVPLPARLGAAEALVLHCQPGAGPRDATAALTELGAILAHGLAMVGNRQQDRRRIRRLERILQIANQWSRTREVAPLLVQMAEAATQLLAADRASIFVWDRRNHTLVGRPALGVEEGELRIPDDRGVVGRVVQTGQPMRVDAATEPREIDHHVDAQLGYKTKSLLCVPMRGRSGELFGAFELLNSLSGAFSAEDEAALVELAAQAAIALERAQDRENLLSITEQAAERVRLIGKSPAVEALRSIIRRVADTDLAVLILGENGTGKEVVAQSIHYLSVRREKPFIAVNCAAIPDTLAESELFGHEKGAFTDARDTRQGKFELAADGTLFLDEIADLSLNCQAKLLRVLEEKVLIRVGGSTPIHTSARVLAATNQNLAELVREKRFREDLYFRLNVVTLELPPLRERPGDIMILARHFLEDFAKKARRETPTFSEAAQKRLETHAWPGNVRELRNLMERLAYLSTNDRIEAEDLAFILAPRGSTPLVASLDRTLAEATQEFQVEYIKKVIERADGNMTEAASQLGLHRSNLYRKMRQLRMPIPT